MKSIMQGLEGVSIFIDDYWGNRGGSSGEPSKGTREAEGCKFKRLHEVFLFAH